MATSRMMIRLHKEQKARNKRARRNGSTAKATGLMAVVILLIVVVKAVAGVL